MGHPDFPPHLTDKQPLFDILETLGFVPNDKAGYERAWGNVAFSICLSFDCWFLVRASICRPREFWPPYEVRVVSPIAPLDLFATIYRLWAEPNTRQDPPDGLLLLGKRWLDYQREVKALVPPPPAIWAERDFLRYCMTYIERMHDWTEADYEVCFSQAPGQLRIKAKDIEVYCPARGNWIGEVVVSAKDLFRRLQKRFIGRAVCLAIGGETLLIDSRVIPARWMEQGAGSAAEKSDVER